MPKPGLVGLDYINQWLIMPNNFCHVTSYFKWDLGVQLFVYITVLKKMYKCLSTTIYQVQYRLKWIGFGGKWLFSQVLAEQKLNVWGE